MSDPNKSCYGILDLEPSATAAEIREAYLDLVKVWHPDRFSKESPRLKHKVEEKLKAINKAYETLRSGADAFQIEHQEDVRPAPGRDNPNLKPMCFGERWGYVNSNEKLVIPPRFARAEPFIEGSGPGVGARTLRLHRRARGIRGLPGVFRRQKLQRGPGCGGSQRTVGLRQSPGWISDRPVV